MKNSKKNARKHLHFYPPAPFQKPHRPLVKSPHQIRIDEGWSWGLKKLLTYFELSAPSCMLSLREHV